MPRPLSLVVLVATAACAPAPAPLAPAVVPPLAAPAPPSEPQVQPRITLRFDGFGIEHRDGMPVAVPDTKKLERMPVARPDTMNDRAMVRRGGTFTIRGPAGLAPVNPSSDSLHLAAPRP